MKTNPDPAQLETSYLYNEIKQDYPFNLSLEKNK
jgi:hypothetical protein